MCFVKFIEVDNGKVYNGEDCITDVVNYVMDPVKTTTEAKRVCVSNSMSSGCSPFPFPKHLENDPGSVIFLIKTNVMCFGKGFDDIFRHRIITFHSGELALPDDLNLLGRSLIEYYSRAGFIACYGLHKDTYEYHLHILVNTTSYIDGHKMNIFNEFKDVHQVIDGWYKFYMNPKLDDPEVVEEYNRKIFGDGSLPAHLTSLGCREQIKTYKKCVSRIK